MKGNTKPKHSSTNPDLNNWVHDDLVACAWEDHSFQSSTTRSKFLLWAMKWFFVFRTCWARLKEEAVSLLGWYSPRGVRISQSLAGRQTELARSLEQNKALGETFSCNTASIPNYSGSSFGDFKNDEVIGLECIWFLQRKLQESHGLENCRSVGFPTFPATSAETAKEENLQLWGQS